MAPMPTDKPEQYFAALHRKLRGIAALLRDRAATGPEKATAEAIKARLEKQLREEGAPAGDWTDIAFRFGRTVKKMGKSAPSAPGAPEGDWTKHAFLLGKALRKGINKVKAGEKDE
jgi:hypothetical protein